MANYSKNINTMRSRSQLTRFLGYPNGFRGVDVTSPERLIADGRLAHVRNMWKDYKSEGGACIETFPGWRRLLETKAGKIHGMWRYNKFVVLHIGTGLFALDEKNKEAGTVTIPASMADPEHPSSGLVINNSLFILDGEHYLKINYNEATNVWTVSDPADGAYQPTLYASHTKLDGYPQGYEQRNMLNDAFTESFVITEADIEPDTSTTPATYYMTLFSKIKTITAVTLAGAALSTSGTAPYYGVDTTGDDPRLYIVSAEDIEGKYITVQGTQPTAYFKDDFYKVDYASCIKRCTIMAEYDGRIFYTGNPMFPTKVWYTQRDINGYNRPDYIGELNYWTDGTSGATNLSFLVANDKLCVLQRNGDGTGGIYIHYGVDSGEGLTPRIYPSDYSALSEAPYGPCANFRDDPVFLTPHGLDAIGKQQVNLERSIEHRSTNVDGKLWKEDLKNAVLCQFEGYLFVACPSGNVYLADSRQLWTNNDTADVEYEWYLLDGFGDYYTTNKKYTYMTNSAEILPGEQLYVKRSEYLGEDEITLSGTITVGEEVKVVSGWRPDHVYLTYETSGDPGSEVVTVSGRIYSGSIPSSISLGWRPSYIDLTYDQWHEADEEDEDDVTGWVTVTQHLTSDTTIEEDINYIRFTDTGFDYMFAGTGFNDPYTRENIRYTAGHTAGEQPTAYTVTVELAPDWVSPGGSYLSITDYGFTGLIDEEDTGVRNPRYRVVKDSFEPEYVPLRSDSLPHEISLAEVKAEYAYLKTDSGFVRQPGRSFFTEDFILVDRSVEPLDEPVQTEAHAGLLLASDDTLYIGSLLGSCEESTLMCLNTDKRGEAYVNNLDVLEPVPPGTMHRVWYSRCGQPYVSSLTTRFDDCGYPHCRKNTVRKSVDIELRAAQDSLVKFMWRTDRENIWHEEAFDANAGNNMSGFFEQDFGNQSFDGSGHRIFVSDEHAKLYTDKQFCLKSEALGSAFGLYHISYRWIVNGRIKN